MHTFSSALVPPPFRWMFAMLLLLPLSTSAQLTWDADTATAGVQEGNGTWNTTLTNWYDGTSNVAWNNTTNANTIAVFGLNTATAGGTITVSGTINLGGMKFVPFASTPNPAHTFSGSGTLAFADNATIELSDLVSSGSTGVQFVNLNTLITGNNLTLQRAAGSTSTFQYLKFATPSVNSGLVGTLTIKSNSASVGVFALVASAASNSGFSKIVIESGSVYAISGTNNNYAVPITMGGLGQNNGAIRVDSSGIVLSGGITLTSTALIHTNALVTGVLVSSGIGESTVGSGYTRSGVSAISTVTYTGTSNFTGATTFGRSSANGGVNIFDFSAAGAPVTNLFYNGVTAGALNIIGGNSGPTLLNFVGKAGTNNSQSFGNVSVSGASAAIGALGVINLTSDTGGRMDLSLGTITRVAGNQSFLTINAAAAGDVSTTSTTGFLGPWITYRRFNGMAGWAQVVGGKVTDGFVGDLLHVSGTAISALPGYAASGNLNISSASTGNVTVTGATTDINTVTMNDPYTDRLVALPSSILRLGATGGIQLDGDARNLTIGQPGSAGTLTAGGAASTAGQLIVTNNSTDSTITINSVIANNGSGAVTLLFNGTAGSKTILTGANTFTGGSTVVSGAVEMQSAGALGSSGTLTVMEGAALQLSSGISVARSMSIGGTGIAGDGALRSLSGSNSIGGLITLLAASRINVDSGTLTLFLTNASTNIITGTFPLTLGGAGNVVVNSRIATSTGSLTKDGTGMLTLAGDNTYTGATTVSGGTLKLGSTTALGVTSGVVIATGGTLDLNGQTTDRSFTSINSTGVGSLGALINSSTTPATVTGTTALSGVSTMGGTGNITITNATGLTGNFLLTKLGSGTLTVIDSTTTSGRTGTTEIDAGTLRVQAATAIAPIGTGAYALNGGTLSLGFDVTNVMTNVVNVLSDSTIIADRASGGPGGTVLTLSTLTIGGNTLTLQAGSNVSSGTIGLTLGSVSLGGVSMRAGNPTFDVQSTAAAALTLTLGAFNDQAIAPRTITFQNSGAAASAITLGTAATSLVDGTVVNLNNGTSAGVTVNLTNVTALGSLSQVTVNGNSTLTEGVTNVVLGSLAGTGTVNASGAFTLIIGNAASASPVSSNFSGVLSNGTGTLTLTKAGLGTLTLSGTTSNSFTGVTSVTGGTLVLGKTGVATAITPVLTIGALAAATAGNATVRLDADNQMWLSFPAASQADSLTINAGGTLDTNGHILTVNTLAAFFGATVSGSGTLALNRTGGTIGFTGLDTISSTFQLTTSTGSGVATRTVAVGPSSGVTATDQLTISGAVTQATGVAGSITKTLPGTLVLSGDNSYSGLTTINGGIINIRSANALGTTAQGTIISAGTTLQIQGGITTAAEGLSITSTAGVNNTGFAGGNGINIQTGALVNVSGVNNYTGLLSLSIGGATISSDSGTLNLTNSGTISGATFGITLAGAGDGSISSIIGTTTGTVTKNGTGTWTLKGVNTSTGAIIINAGTLKLGDGTTGRWSTTPGLTYTGSGLFEFGGSTLASTQGLGALTLTAGGGTLKVDAPASGTNAVSFTSLTTPAFGTGLNIVSPANTTVTLSGSSNVNGIIDPRITYNGVDFAFTTGGVISAAATTTATSSLSGGNSTPYLISGSFAQTSSVTANAGIKFAGSDTFTINNGVLLTINNGTNAAGGILITGGVAAVIADDGGATGLTTGGSGDLVLTTNAVGDSLNIQAPITSTTTGGVTKNGAGTVTLSGTNAYTGTTSVNAGTLILGNAAALSTSAVTVQVGGVLDLNGRTITNAATLNGTGISGGGALINNSGTTASIGALTIGLGNGTGGIGASIGGTGNIISTGTLTGDNILVKTGAGTLTVGSNGATALPSTRVGAVRIDAGTLRVSNSTTALGTAAAAMILNGGTLSLGSSASVAAYPVSVTASSTVVSDLFTAGSGLTHTLGVLVIGGQTLTIQTGINVSVTTNAGVTFGATTLIGNATFDVQNLSTATTGTTTLTLGALSDLGVARTITFTNSGSASTNSVVTLATAMASLIDGTVVNVTSGANAGVTLNLNNATAIGTLAQVTVSGKSMLSLGTAQTIGSLNGDGNVIGAFALTVGNANSGTALNSNYSGVLGFGGVATALIKSGLGTLTLSGANAYTGATTVNMGTLKLNNAAALGATSGVTIAAGGTVDLNGQSTGRNFTSISGAGYSNNGALINSSSTTATITGSTALAAAARIGGSGNITVSNTGGLTGNFLLTKFGTGTLTFISTATSARSFTNEIDEGTLRVQAATAIAPLGTGTFTLNGGTLSLGFDVTNAANTGAVNLLASSTIVVDRASSGAGGQTFTLGAMITGGSTLTVQAGSNVASGTIGLTLGTVTIGGPSLPGGNPVFDVQSSSTAATTLTLGAVTDQAIAPRTITFQNSGTTASTVTLGTAATSLVDGTQVNLSSTGGAVTVNMNAAGALGTFAQITVGSGNTLALGAAQTIAALNGTGTVTAATDLVLTIGNTASSTVSNSVFNGALTGSLSVLKNGAGSLTLGGPASNTFSGSSATVINSGTLILAKTGGAVAIPASLTLGSANGISGTASAQLNASEQIASTATLTVNANSSMNLNGFNQTLGNLNGSPGATITNNAVGTSSMLTLGSGDATGGQYLGSIADGAGAVALTKTGAGSSLLGAGNSYSGATLVQGGTLQVGSSGIGTTGTGAVTVQSGATLSGTGIVQGVSFTAASGSFIQAGDGTAQASFGTLNFKPASGSGTIDFQAGSTIVLGLNPGGTSDLLNIVGTGTTSLNLNGNITVTATGYTPSAPAVFNLLDWSGLASSPIFDSRFSYSMPLLGNGDEASGFDLPDISGSGYTWDISSFTTNGTISVVAVPEPARVLLLGMAMGLMLTRRRR
ncbi:beta strand repeat-containing protein [Prosthecobacter sp.]|uniref:beta strand repeat-containing protein n=1 Tax=Prosthecobacter sp. TaxID=1965333 RepID=UPI00378337ED